MGNKDFKVLIILLVILAIAVFFRLWQLDEIPPGLYPDVAINGNDALTALRTGDFKVFYPENNGREGLFMNLIAVSFFIFGFSIWSIKVVAVIFGILTVLGTYLLTKELFRNLKYKADKAEYVALLASFFIGVSFWHVLFSRIGFRAIMVPFVIVFGLYFLLRAFRTKKIADFILSGIFWGLGLHTYISYRMAIIILGVFFILKLIEYLKEERIKISPKEIWSKMFLRDGWWKIAIFVLAIIITALPILLYFLDHPQDFMGRASGVSIFKQENPIGAGFKSLLVHLAMFNFYGDANWRHNSAGSPMLFWPVGILFIIGFILSFAYLIKSFRAKDFSLFIFHFLLLTWFFSMLLGGVLSYEGIPHALRVIGVIPVVYIFSAQGGLLVYDWLVKIVKNKKFIVVFSLSFIIFVGYSEFYKYFSTWTKNPNVQGAFTKKFADVGYYLNSLPQDTEKYVIVNEPGVPVPFPDGIPMPSQTIMFIESTKFGRPQSIYLLPEDLDKVKIDEDTENQPFEEGLEETVIVPMKYEERIFNELKQRWPQGQVEIKDEIFSYKINH